MQKQRANEKKYKQWRETNEGRLYYRKVQGQKGWYAVYCKQVDKEENTLRFWQEIYDAQNNLKEIHHKYPEDKGHKKFNTQ